MSSEGRRTLETSPSNPCELLESATGNMDRKERVCEELRQEDCRGPALEAIYCGPQGVAEASYYVLAGVPLSILDWPAVPSKKESRDPPRGAFQPQLPSHLSPHHMCKAGQVIFHPFLYVNDLHSMGQLLTHRLVSPPRHFLSLVINGPARK